VFEIKNPSYLFKEGILILKGSEKNTLVVKDFSKILSPTTHLLRSPDKI